MRAIIPVQKLKTSEIVEKVGTLMKSRICGTKAEKPKVIHIPLSQFAI
jgi:hypothetical protein